MSWASPRAVLERTGAFDLELLRCEDVDLASGVVVRALATPGHTPEHIAFLVTDTAAASEPIAIVTGDFVFVGDVVAGIDDAHAGSIREVTRVAIGLDVADQVAEVDGVERAAHDAEAHGLHPRC